MKIPIMISLLISLISISITALSKNIVAPPFYTCSMVTNSCTCFQTGNLDFPSSFKVDNDCGGKVSFIVIFSGISGASKTIPKQVSAQYGKNIPFIATVLSVNQIYANITPSSSWIYRFYDYSCYSEDINKCPLTDIPSF